METMECQGTPCQDMVFLNFYFDLFVAPPSLFMLLCSRPCRDYFPIIRDPSRSSLTSRDASRFSRYFLPMHTYSFLTFPMRTTIILLVHSTLIVIFFSPLISFFPFFFMFFSQVTPKEQAQDEYDWRETNGTTIDYGHPLRRTIATRTHGKRQEFVSFPWSQEDRRRGPKPPVHSLLDQLQAGRAVAVSRRPGPQPFAPHFSWESSNHAHPLPRVPRVHLFQTRSRTGIRARDSSGSDAGSS